MPARVRAIRGATTLDDDDRDQLDERIPERVETMLERNGVDEADIVSIVFTSTADITCGFPATSARRLGLADTPVMGALEVDVAGALPLAVRILMHVYSERAKAEIQHVYLHGATVLRPDLAVDQ